MPREVVITKESTFRLAQGDFNEIRTTVSRLTLQVEEDGVGAVVERTTAGGEHAYGRDRLRAELGEHAWQQLMTALGVAQ